VAAISTASAWEGERVLDGFASIGRVEAELSKAQDNPMDRPRQFEKARHHWKSQWFIREITRLRYAFYNFGFRLGAEGGSESAVKKWAKSSRKQYRRYAREAWLEWLIQDNVVGIWRQKGGKPPVVYPPENCQLIDVWGTEMLKIRHGVTQDIVTTIGAFSKVEQAEFAKNPNEIKLTHDNPVFGFDVLRRERTGSGFGVPTVADIFSVAAEMVSSEVALQTLAAACRLVIEQHALGYEIKSGLHAGSKANHMAPERVDGLKKELKGKTGHIRLATNFDQKIIMAANWPDPKHFSETRFSAGMMRLAIWSMPLGQMLLGKNMNPFLMTMLRVQAAAEREFMEEHLRTIFIEGLGAPENLKLRWSNQCFVEPRIAADLLKTGLAAGPISQETFTYEAGFDREDELENKEQEAKLPKSHTHPIYDAAHGPEKKPAGRKQGTRDGDGD
jgi:hypothetical protein